MIYFKYNLMQKISHFQAEFLTSFSHLAYHKNNLSLANFSNFCTDFIHSYYLSRTDAGKPRLIYRTNTILTYKLYAYFRHCHFPVGPIHRTGADGHRPHRGAAWGPWGRGGG